MKSSNVIPFKRAQKSNLHEKDDLTDEVIGKALGGHKKERDQLLKIHIEMFDRFLLLIDISTAPYALLSSKHCSQAALHLDAQAWIEHRHEFYKRIVEAETGRKEAY